MTHAVGVRCRYVSPAAYQPDAAQAYDKMLEVRCCTSMSDKFGLAVHREIG